MLTASMLPAAGLIGIVLLVVMVSARRFLCNVDGTVLALTIIAVAVLALALGAIFQLNPGFCNAICPVLPVERLYGQRPLLRVDNPRCVPERDDHRHPDRTARPPGSARRTGDAPTRSQRR